MSNTQHHFIWVDVETTGLTPQRDLLLEIAAVLAEDGPGGSCQPVDAYVAVVRCAVDGRRVTYAPSAPWCANDTADLDDYVLKMHTGNGLLAECQTDAAKPLAQVDTELAAWMKERGAKRGTVIAGNSVHFDRGFVRVHLPSVDALLSHRVGDFTAARLMFEAFSGVEVVSPMPDNHRALDDIIASLQGYAALRALWASTGDES